MININISTLIYQPIGRVFEFVSTPENDFQWQYGTVVSSKVTEKMESDGNFFRSVANLMGHRVQSVYEVLDYEPNKKYSFKALSGPLNSHTAYTFEMEGGSTKISISIQANVINFFQVNEGILEKKMKKQIKENLAMLKNLLEEKKMHPVSETNPLGNTNIN